MKIEINVIIITWELYDLNADVIKNFNKPRHYGLYQIYGNHNAYGKNVLLYIGKAQDQKFATRLQNGGNRIFNDFLETTVEPTHIRLGFISMSNKQEDISKYNLLEYEKNWDDNISVAERILIATHPPALNKQISHKLPDVNRDKDYLIVNWGDYGDILPEVSTLRNSHKFYDFDNYFLGDTKE